MQNSRFQKDGVKGKAQIPLPPGAGFLAVVAGGKPDKPGERMLRCLSMPDLTHRDARVLAVLAYHDGPGGCWPSAETIAREAGLPSRGRVFDALSSLEAKGAIEREHGRDANRYRLDYSRGQCPEFPDSVSFSSVSGNDESECPENPDTNRNEPQASFSGADLCDGDRCEGDFVEPGDECRRCGWRRSSG